MRGLGRPLLVAALLIAACTSDSKPQGVASSSSAASSGSASLTLQGESAFTGPVPSPEVTCQSPDVNGLRIAVLATARDKSFLRIAIGPDDVTIIVNSGSDSTAPERTFSGHGVSRFDATKGATVDAHLSEGGAPGPITAIKGTVECGDQTPGSSTITVTGDTGGAHLDHARIDPVLVECYFSAGEVIVLGIAQGGTAKVQLLVSITSQGLGVEEELQPSGQRRYSGSLSGASITTTGGHADGDVVEKDATPPHTLHVEGDAVCGTPLRG